MELWSNILCSIIDQKNTECPSKNWDFNPKEIIETECYKALKSIRDILDDMTLDDAECYHKIEKIICLFEAMGSDGCPRHDYSKGTQ
ncbi:hypothetical protein [Anaerotignum sp.]